MTMGALMLVFALTAVGPETMALLFPSMDTCEAGQEPVKQLLIAAKAEYIALACVVPTKLEGV
jgi:hypothetical protein